MVSPLVAPSLPEFEQIDLDTDTAFAQAIMPMHPNAQKKRLLGKFVRQGSKSANWQLFSGESMLGRSSRQVARYLGSQLSYNGSTACERAKRLRAAQVVYVDKRKSTHLGRKIKKNIEQYRLSSGKSTLGQDWERRKLITHLRPACSRDQKEKIYVQTRMQEPGCGEDLYDALVTKKGCLQPPHPLAM